MTPRRGNAAITAMSVAADVSSAQGVLGRRGTGRLESGDSSILGQILQPGYTSCAMCGHETCW